MPQITTVRSGSMGFGIAAAVISGLGDIVTKEGLEGFGHVGVVGTHWTFIRWIPRATQEACTSLGCVEPWRETSEAASERNPGA